MSIFGGLVRKCFLLLKNSFVKKFIIDLREKGSEEEIEYRKKCVEKHNLTKSMMEKMSASS